MKRRIIGGLAIAVGVVLLGACGEYTPAAATSEIEKARSYLEDTKPSDAEVDGDAWDRGIVLRVKHPAALDNEWKMDVLLANGTSTTITSAQNHADELNSLISPGDYVAFNGGIDDRVLPEEVKIIKAGAVSIGEN